MQSLLGRGARRGARGCEAAAALASLPPSPAASLSRLQRRAMFSWLKRLVGLTEREAQISELRSEAANQLDAMGDLQAELHRTRGELSAAQKRLAAATAERNSLTAGRAAAVASADARAQFAEAQGEALRSLLAQISKLSAGHGVPEKVRALCRGARAARRSLLPLGFSAPLLRHRPPRRASLTLSRSR